MGCCVRWRACKPHSSPLQIICQASSASICGRKKNHKNLILAFYSLLVPQKLRRATKHFPTRIHSNLELFKVQKIPFLPSTKQFNLAPLKRLSSALNPFRNVVLQRVLCILRDFCFLIGFKVGNLSVSSYQFSNLERFNRITTFSTLLETFIFRCNPSS